MNPFIERLACRMICSTGIAVLSLVAAYAADGVQPFIPRIIISSTIPANGDLNPYGLAFVPDGFASGGMIAPGDVLVSNFTPGVLERLGIGYEDLRAVNPRIIVVEMPAFGPGGPDSGHQGMGKTMEAATGMAALMGYGDGVPSLTGPAYLRVAQVLA